MCVSCRFSPWCLSCNHYLTDCSENRRADLQLRHLNISHAPLTLKKTTPFHWKAALGKFRKKPSETLPVKCTKNSHVFLFLVRVFWIPSQISSSHSLETDLTVNLGIRYLFSLPRHQSIHVWGHVWQVKDQIWQLTVNAKELISSKARRRHEIIILLLTVALCLYSASGASVVAIDNKIEQAMVSFHTF